MIFIFKSLGSSDQKKKIWDNSYVRPRLDLLDHKNSGSVKYCYNFK